MYRKSKDNILKCKTKHKKIKPKIICDLDYIKKLNSKSCQKKCNENISNNINITNNIFVLNNIKNDFAQKFEAKKEFDLFRIKISNKSNFEIDLRTFDVKTKNKNANNELNDENFWILYSEYLIKENIIKNSNEFIKIMNNAFSNIDKNKNKLITYYLEKIKKLNPIITDGKIEDKDEPYINLLPSPARNIINEMKNNLTSKIKLNKKIYKTETKNNFEKIFHKYKVNHFQQLK